MKKRELSYTPGGKVSWYSHYGEQYGDFLNTKNWLPYAIPFLGIYLGKIIIGKDMCNPMFTATIIAKTWKHPNIKDLENKLIVTREEGLGGGIHWEFATDVYTLLCFKYTANKNLQYSIGNSAQYSTIIQMGKNNTYMYMYSNHFAVHLKLTNYC